MIDAYLPAAPDFGILLAFAVTATGLSGLGRLLAGRAAAPDVTLVAGWGALCLGLTAWGVLTTATLTIPLFGLGVVALVGLRGWHGPGWGVMLMLPLFAVLLPARPSQVDTWLNLLPNLAFLVDHGTPPQDGGPPSWSFLPGAPYNTQFVGFAISRLAGRLAANALSLFNTLLLGAAGLCLARVVCASRQPPAWAWAAGLLLAMPLNPGFTPRVFLAGYGEAPLAVCLMLAVSLGADLFAAERAGGSDRRTWIALALVLAALVNIKQSALGLLLPFVVSLLVIGLAAPGLRHARWAGLVILAAAPALALYSVWRWYVLGHFAVGELKMLPLAEWHLNLLGPIAAGIAFAMFQKATYFLAIAVMIAAAAIEARRRPWQKPAVLLGLGTGLAAGFGAFLLFTYVAHFPAVWAVNAHSFFRYMSQLSLVVVLALTAWLRPRASDWLEQSARGAWLPGRRGWIAGSTVATVLLLPVAGARLVRFDLDPPQPFLWEIGHRAARVLQDGDKVALVTPGDGDDAAGSLLRGVLMFTPPRRTRLDFVHALAATPDALVQARAAGMSRALVTCAPAGLAGLAAGTGGILAWENGTWRVLMTWPMPPGLARTRFSAMLPHAPFCR